MGGDRVPSGNLLSPNESSSIRTGLHPIELLTKSVLRNSPNNPGCCYSQNDGKALLLKTTPTQLIEYREVMLVST